MQVLLTVSPNIASVPSSVASHLCSSVASISLVSAIQESQGKASPYALSRLLNPGSHLTGEKSVNRSFSPSSPRPDGSLLLAEDAGSDIVVDRLAIAIVRIAEAAATT